MNGFPSFYTILTLDPPSKKFLDLPLLTAARLVATCTLHFALVQFDAQWYQLYHVGFCISHKSNEIAESLGMLRSCFSIECKLEKLVSLEIQSKNCKLFGVNHHFQNPRSAPEILQWIVPMAAFQSRE